jgi:cell division transport system permease protein
VIIANAFLTSSLKELESKVDVNVYFTTTAPDADITALKTRIEALPEVAQVEYLDRKQALERFVERNKGNALILQSLEEIGDNPLGAVFNIRAYSPDQYAGIVEYLNKQNDNVLGGSGSSIIDSINYYDNQKIIDRLSSLTTGVRKIGIFIAIILILMAALVTASTIRLAIYNSRQEISIMRLVGAGNSYIRGPFVIEGILYGFCASLLSLAILYPATLWVTKITANFFLGIDLVHYYISNFGQILIILLASGIILGMFSSFLAVRRYLQV